ncbi:MAG: hypothetical protein UR43_C0010G0024 [candidate division TM6 bacterium GW2011_GWF2_33_332]|nr:MAG: hypothetical protein UR43_C0010G0024 [candidate division TM6 bacterium GW2011_GWF2_33_332]
MNQHQFLLIILAVLFSSCVVNKKIEEKEARIIWRGDPGYDGQGFIIEIDNETFKATNESKIRRKMKEKTEADVLLKFKRDKKTRIFIGTYMGGFCMKAIKIRSVKFKL